MDTTIKPLIAESSTSESTSVQVVLEDYRDNLLRVPDYQRDSNQWDNDTKSLFIESVINNLPVPAFFFEVKMENEIEVNHVVDGQQRITTLAQFYNNDFELVGSDKAPYISPQNIHYAGKKYQNLPDAYKHSFRRYRLSVIKLRDLDKMRLEVFRRINKGGTPLSGHDIRLAYYGEGSPSLALVRIAGVFDRERDSSQRFLKSAKKLYNFDDLWTSNRARAAWEDWWKNKEMALGQAPSEMFLWYLVAAEYDKLDSLVKNSSIQPHLDVRYHDSIDEALDVYCAQLRWQDNNPTSEPLIFSSRQIRDELFPFFQGWIEKTVAASTALGVSKHRTLAAVIGAAWRLNLDYVKVGDEIIGELSQFIKSPMHYSKSLDVYYPKSRGRWSGLGGYSKQMESTQQIVLQISRAY